MNVSQEETASRVGSPSTLPPVLHVTTVHAADDARILYREAAGLHANGWTVGVAGPYPQGVPAVVEGVSITPLSKPTGRIWRIVSSPWRALLAVARSKAKLIHFHDPELLPVALMSKWFLRRRVVYDAHEDVSLMLLKDWIPRLLRKPISWAVQVTDRFCARRVDAVVTPTRLLQDKYAALAPRAGIFINYPAVAFLHERDETWCGVEKKENVIVHLGTLRKARLEFLAKVAESFLQEHPDWSWEFIGIPPEMTRWLEENLSPAVQSRVVGLGRIPHMEVAERLCRAKIGVNYHPLESRQIQVAIPLKVFEYMACGLSVITTRVPLLVELVEDCPAVYLCDDSHADYLRRLTELAKATDVDGLGALARQYSDEQFNCNVEATRLADLYHDILGETA